MKRINVGDWVFCPGKQGPAKVVEKESLYQSGTGRRMFYKVDIDAGGYLASYLREDLQATRFDPDETPPGA